MFKLVNLTLLATVLASAMNCALAEGFEGRGAQRRACLALDDFDCHDDSCIPRYKVCDGRPDCPRGEDEFEECHLYYSPGSRDARLHGNPEHYLTADGGHRKNKVNPRHYYIPKKGGYNNDVARDNYHRSVDREDSGNNPRYNIRDNPKHFLRSDPAEMPAPAQTNPEHEKKPASAGAAEERYSINNNPKHFLKSSSRSVSPEGDALSNVEAAPRAAKDMETTTKKT